MSLPPYAQLLGLSVEEHAGELPTLVMPWSGTVTGRPGFLHGGAIAGLLEMAAIAGLRDALGEDRVSVRPVTLTIDYMRGGREGTTRARAIIRRIGRRIANVDATAWQDDPDRAIAAARLTLMLRR